MQASVGALARNPDTRRAVGLACAAMGANVAALGFTIVFARWLGLARYGSLAALLSTFNILMIPGVGLQTTAAREVSALVAVGDPAAGAGIKRWISRLVVLTAVVTVVSILARQPIADVIGVPDVPWAAAIALPAGSLWLIASVMRGSLQGFRRYRLVGLSIVAEQVARLAFGLGFVGAGLGVTGAYLATPLALVAIAAGLAGPLSAEVRRSARAPGAMERLRDLFRHAGWPVIALALIAWLQEGHVIIVKHLASSNAAGAWGAAAVAAKAIMWIAPGLALYVVPEAARRSRTGSDARRVLALALAIIGVLAAAMVLLYAGVATPLLRTVFKPKAALSAGALPWLGLAMSMLAISYLCAQYQLALHRTRFIAALVVAALVQPAVLVAIGPDLTALAFGMLAVQAVLAATLVGFALRGRARLALSPAAELERVPAALTDA